MQAALGIKSDGDFGPGTEAAVKKWQAANGLTADGIVGPRTMEKLFSKAPKQQRFK
jgi:peptidoglycan hydrolase-like protein with peptidoglycan-binding domain